VYRASPPSDSWAACSPLHGRRRQTVSIALLQIQTSDSDSDFHESTAWNLEIRARAPDVVMHEREQLLAPARHARLPAHSNDRLMTGVTLGCSMKPKRSSTRVIPSDITNKDFRENADCWCLNALRQIISIDLGSPRLTGSPMRLNHRSTDNSRCLQSSALLLRSFRSFAAFALQINPRLARPHILSTIHSQHR
jgi:hypothetical protein